MKEIPVSEAIIKAKHVFLIINKTYSLTLDKISTLLISWSVTKISVGHQPQEALKQPAKFRSIYIGIFNSFNACLSNSSAHFLLNSANLLFLIILEDLALKLIKNLVRWLEFLNVWPCQNDPCLWALTSPLSLITAI